MTDTLTELLALIQKTFEIDPATIDPERPLAEFGLDSLAKAELLFALEDHFKIEFPESDTGVQTLSELATAVARLRTPVTA